METDVEGNSCRLVGSYKTGGYLEGLRNITKKIGQNYEAVAMTVGLRISV